MTLDDGLINDILALVRDPLLPIVLTVAIASVLVKLADNVVHAAFEAFLAHELPPEPGGNLDALETTKRVNTLDGMVTWILRGFIVTIASIMVLSELGVDIGPILAGLGIAGIAVGFGAQSLVKDYFNGALILLENQYARGDVVTIAGTTGTVEDFSLRRTSLRDLDGILHTVPNSEVKVASNRTRVWAQVNLDVTVAHGTDIEQATRVVNEVGEAMAADPQWAAELLETPRVLRVEGIGEFGITLKMLGKVRAPALPSTTGELRRRLLAAFVANGIELPRPRHVVLTKDPAVDPFTPGGPGPSPEELSAGSD